MFCQCVINDESFIVYKKKDFFLVSVECLLVIYIVFIESVLY